MSGVILISKHALLFANKNFKYNFYESNYISSKAQQTDKYFLGILNGNPEDFGTGENLCYNLKIKYEKSGLFDVKSPEYIVDGQTPSEHIDIIDSCILTDGEHRILFKKTSINPNEYVLNSCVLKNTQYCKFETKPKMFMF